MTIPCSNLISHYYIIVVSLILNFGCHFALGATVSYDANAIIIDGQRRVIISGSIHYPRSTPEMWPDLIQKAKDGGLDAIESYVFWNLHEPQKRQYDFTGRADIIKFFQLVQKAGLYGILRVGPYVCSEWNYGGLPVWLHNMPGIKMRTNNEVFKSEMQVFVSKIIGMFKGAKMFAPQGGPIILAQIENEYGNVMESYGADGKAYIEWCAEFAQSLNIGVPWLMCQQQGAPTPMIETCNGYYCDTFKPTNPKSPKIWTENWTGWYEKWGESRVHRAAEDVAYAVALFFQSGGVLQNYYMVSNNIIITEEPTLSVLQAVPFIITMYDYDSPLNEYGGLNQPKWGHLKDLHAAIKWGENILTSGTSTTTKLKDGVILTTFTNKMGHRFCFLNNPNTDGTVLVNLDKDGQHDVPAWSVTILNNCNTEIFNTATVNAPTWIWDYNPIVADERDLAPDMLSWSWVAEPAEDLLAGKGFTFNSTRLLDQKEAAADQSDYLWYMTSPVIRDPTWSEVTLSVNSSGHVLHAFVNGNDLGPTWSTGSAKGKYNFVLERPASLNTGNNVLVLLSATVGLANYGAFFDTIPDGISGGPVRLLKGKEVADLSPGPWFYKVGLDGERYEFYNPNTANKVGWKSAAVANQRPLTWYKANFDTPKGTDPMVVNMMGMNKGHMWVNGKSLGRYWVSMNATKTGCQTTCDYRGTYTPDRCRNFCGQPTQQRYHIPKSYLNSKGLNTLVIFEELGGNPSNVNFALASVIIICRTVYEGQKMDLWCGTGHYIHEVRFVGFGDPQGSCLEFQHGKCEGPDATEKVKQACLSKPGCSLNATSAMFGPDSCTYGFTPKLAVEVTCW